MSRNAVALGIAVLLGLAGTAGPAWADEDPIGFKKGLEDESDRAPNKTPAAEAYLIRAYPATDIPDSASLAARVNWTALNAGAHSAGSWQLIGPSKATYPSVLNPFLFDGAQYVASGRVTAMAISPTLHPRQMHALRRGGGRRRLAHRQGAQRLELAIHLRQLRHERDRLAADGSERFLGQHAVCRHRRAERVGRFGSRRRHLQDDGRRPDMGARSRQRHLLPARDRPDGARQRR